MSEINLIGGFYQANSLSFSAQVTVNWLPVPAKVEGARSPIKLRGLPGLKALFVAPPAPPSGGFVSSTVYPIEIIEALDSGGSLVSGRVVDPILEAMDSGGSLLGGEIRVILRSYNNWPAEAVDSGGSLLSGDFRTILRTYSWGGTGGNANIEAMDSGGSLLSGSLRVTLITYNNWPDEALDSGGSLLGGSLT